MSKRKSRRRLKKLKKTPLRKKTKKRIRKIKMTKCSIPRGVKN